MSDLKKSKPRALVIAPFDQSGDRVRDTIYRALQELDLEVVKPDSTLTIGSNITELIANSIEAADFIVVDITRQNPNVMYELGYAHALRIPTILIMGSDTKSALPTDLAGYNYIVYDKGNLRELSERIQRTAKRLV